MMKYHYVYYSYEEWGRGYIGVRSSDIPPDKDTYLGSFSDRSFCPKHKIVLQTFSSREEAIKAEVVLHNFYRVDINPHFANKARQTSSKFYCSSHTQESKKKMSESRRGKLNPMYGRSRYREKNPFYGRSHSESTKRHFSMIRRGKNIGEGNSFFGKKHTEETKERLSKQAKNRKVSDETKAKISKSLVGRRHSEETILKMRLARREFWNRKKLQSV